MEADLIRLKNRFALPNAAFIDCSSIIELHRSPPGPFSWNEQEVQFFFGQGSLPRIVDNRSERPRLPFEVIPDAYYLVNPAEDSEYPVWIAKVANVHPDPSGGPDIASIRYLVIDDNYRPTKMKDPEYKHPAQTDPNYYYHAYYYIEESEKPDSELLNKLPVDKLNSLIHMQRVVKKTDKDGIEWQRTRISKRSVQTSKQWAERFRDTHLDEEESEFPLTKSQMRQGRAQQTMPAATEENRLQMRRSNLL